MQPDIPILTGGSQAGGGSNPPPVSVESMSRAALADITEAERLRDELLSDWATEAESSYTAADDAAGTLWSEWVNTAVKDLEKSEKARQVVLDAIFNEAVEALDRSHLAARAVGGSSYVMTDESYGANVADSHMADALNMLIIPALEAREREVRAGGPGDGVVLGFDDLTPFDPDAPRDSFSSLIGGPADGSAPPIPLPPPPPPGPIRVPEPEPEPEPEPAPGSPPPPPPPPDGGDDSCPCPSPQLVIRIPGCGDIVVGGEVPTVPPAPPKGGEEQPKPKPPEPPAPQPRPPLAPIGTPESPIAPSASLDSPQLCDFLAAHAQGQKPKGNIEIVDNTFNNSLENLKGLRSGGFFGHLLEDMLGGFLRIGKGVFDWGYGLVRSVAGAANSKDSVAVGAAEGYVAAGGVAGFFERWLGMPLTYFTTPWKQIAQYWTPLETIPQGEVDQAHLANVITAEQWECLTRMNGNRPWQHYQALLAKRAQIGVQDALQLYMRGEISREVLDTKMRQLGFLDGKDVDSLLVLQMDVPTVSTLFMWLKKDVWDNKFAADFGLDEDFPQNPPPEWVKWIKANGLTMEQVKYEYRATWELPPKTQVDEFIRRLRPGRVAKDLEFTMQDAERLYKLNEVPAGVRKRLIAVSYQPVAMTYLIEGYKAGVLPEAELFERLQDIGYNAVDARFLTSMIVAKAKGQLQGRLGAWTPRVIISRYVEGALTELQADKLLSRTILSQQERNNAIADADAIRDANRRRTCIRGIRRRYFTGEYTIVDARIELMGLDVEQKVIAAMLAAWECERTSRSKEPTVKQLTEWAVLGIITVLEFRRRLVNLGFAPADADRIVTAADMQERIKRAKGKK